MKNILILIFLCCLYTACVSTDVDVSSGLTGVVIEGTTNQPLADCLVSISPSNQSVTTDLSGNFDFGKVDMGEYTLSVFYSGYKRYNQPILLKATEVLHHTVELHKATLPEVSTLSYENLTDRTVTLTGIIDSDGGIDLSEAGFYYGTTENPKRKALADVDEDKLTVDLSELSPSTKYYYRAYAKNEIGETLGEIKSFVTEELQLSGVATLDASNITSNSATINAIIPDGEDLVETCGFYVWTYGKYPDKYNAIYSKSYRCEIPNLIPGVRYYYKAFVANAKKENVGETKSFVAIRLENNGHEYVDMGLPSGTLWATKNLGAASEYEPGDFFAWGEVEPKTSFSIDNYKYVTKTVKEEYGQTINYYDFNKYIPEDGLEELLTIDDAATYTWGDDWRMPSDEQIKELCEKCIWKSEVINGRDVYIVIGPSGAELIIPLVGYYRTLGGDNFIDNETYYWSRTVRRLRASVYSLELTIQSVSQCTLYRSSGAQVRPILNK